MIGRKGFFKRFGAWAPAIIILGIIAIAIAAVVIPYIFIWALNTLFGLSIQFNFYTWLAAVIILLIFMPKGKSYR